MVIGKREPEPQYGETDVCVHCHQTLTYTHTLYTEGWAALGQDPRISAYSCPARYVQLGVAGYYPHQPRREV